VFGSECKPNRNQQQTHGYLAMPLVAPSIAGVHASQFPPSASSSSRLLPALARRRRRRTRAHRSLMTPAGTGGDGRARLQVRAARLESTGVSVGFRAPQFEVVPSPQVLCGLISCQSFQSRVKHDADALSFVVSCC
jgi:hypothetical protein